MVVVVPVVVWAGDGRGGGHAHAHPLLGMAAGRPRTISSTPFGNGVVTVWKLTALASLYGVVWPARKVYLHMRSS